MLESEDSSYEHISSMLDKLYVNKVPEVNTAIAGLYWFVSGGNTERRVFPPLDVSHGSNEKVIDYTYDQENIFGAFLVHGVDLETTDMHWFKFLIMIANLNKCTLTEHMGYRAMNLSDIEDKDERKRYSKLKVMSKVRMLVSLEDYNEILAERKATRGYAEWLDLSKKGIIDIPYDAWRDDLSDITDVAGEPEPVKYDNVEGGVLY